MPAFITHHLQALCVFERLSDSTLDKTSFCLGAQGPDFLYFHRAVPIIQPGRSCRKIGTLLHELAPERVFGAFSEYLKQHPHDNYARSYALGFLCHYSLDRTAHPYVYAQQREFIKQNRVRYYEGCVHSRMEHSLDVVVLREQLSRSANRCRVDEFTPRDKRILDAAAAALEYVIRHTTDCKMTRRQIITAFCDNRLIQRLSYDPHSIKYNIVRTAERIFFIPPSLSTFIRRRCEDKAWDYANYSHQDWRNPFDESADCQNDDFMQVFGRAVEDSLDMIRRFEQGSDNVTDNISCKTGLPMKQVEG